MQASTDHKSGIESTVAGNKVTVYSKTYCPHAGASKKLLSENGIDAKIIELDTMGEQGAAIQAALKEMTGQGTVPSVWVNGKHIGGNSDLQSKGAAWVKEQIA